MASPHIISIEELLQPVSEDNPQGVDIRENSSSNSVYYQIKDARSAARAAERASLFDPEQASGVMKAWRPILDLAPTVLKGHSKDLEVVSWYLEALLRFHGFVGLRDGIALARGLVDQYWENLYPEPDEDGIETKVAPLAGLNGDSGEGTLLAPMRNAQITIDSASGSFSYWQYQQARDADKINDQDKKEEKIESLGFSLQTIEHAVAEASSDFYANMVEDLESCVTDFKAMNETLRQHCGHEAPPYSLILQTLEEILRSVRFMAKDKLASKESEAAEPEAATEQSGMENTPRSSSAAPSGPVASREDALKKLEEVAQYFRMTEPHTPLVTGIERLVRWGRMPMADLVKELIPDSTALAFYQHLTGANFNAEDDSSSSYAATAQIASSTTTSKSASTTTDTPKKGGGDLGW